MLWFFLIVLYITIGFGISAWLYKPEYSGRMIFVLFLWPITIYDWLQQLWRDRNVFRF